MEIKEMNFEQLKERRGQLAEEISGADAERYARPRRHEHKRDTRNLEPCNRKRCGSA